MDNLCCRTCGSSGLGASGVTVCPYETAHKGAITNWKTVEFYLKYDKPIGEPGS